MITVALCIQYEDDNRFLAVNLTSPGTSSDGWTLICLCMCKYITLHAIHILINQWDNVYFNIMMTYQARENKISSSWWRSISKLTGRDVCNNFLHVALSLAIVSALASAITVNSRIPSVILVFSCLCVVFPKWVCHHVIFQTRASYNMSEIMKFTTA